MKHIMPQEIQDKLRLCSTEGELLAVLSEFVAADQIPRQYGGRMEMGEGMGEVERRWEGVVRNSGGETLDIGGFG